MTTTRAHSLHSLAALITSFIRRDTTTRTRAGQATQEGLVPPGGETLDERLEYVDWLIEEQRQQEAQTL